jgi:uncharacterized protein involved in exopolysaccharide biosynthesis/Mrp family chromosome partitioning ATPase
MFNYDEPAGSASMQREAGPTVSGGAFDIAHMARLLIRNAGWLIGAALACAIIAVVVGKSLTPKYAATAQLYIDPRELQLVERELSPRSQDQSALAMVVESQVRLMTSSNVLLKAVGDLKLTDDAEFSGRSALGQLWGLFSFGAGPVNNAADERAAVVETLRRHVAVKRTDRTFIVDIEAWSSDAAKSALLANAVADAYLAESKEAQATAARRATVDLSGRLKELQERLRVAENDLATYKSRNNFVGSQDTQVNDQQLLSSTQRLANAQAATLDAKAKFHQIEAMRKNATDPGAIYEALQSPTIASLRNQFAEVRRRQAELLAELGPLHPSIRMADKQVEDLRRVINEELARFEQSAKNDLARAQDLEASLAKSLDAQKRQSADLGQASVRLRELERDVEASRAIYQSFLKRSRETEEQESLNTSSARIIGVATPPRTRVFPPAMSLLAMIGFVLGGIAATACVLLRDRVRPLHAPLPTPREPVQRRAAPAAPVAVVQPPVTPVVTAAPAVAIAEPVYFRLQEEDVLRTLTGVFPLSGAPDLVRLGWPTLHAGPASSRLAQVALRMTELVGAMSPAKAAVIAAVGLGCDDERTVIVLNLALAASRAGRRVLVIDADRVARAISKRLESRADRHEPRHMADSAGVETMSGVAIQRLAPGVDGATVTALEAARRGGLYDLILLDGPALPAGATDVPLLAASDGVLVVIPGHLPAHDHLQKTTSMLHGAERRLVGVAFSELAAGSQARASMQQSA